MMEHPAVAEAGVIGKPDHVAGEIVKAFVTLKPGYKATEELLFDLVAFGRQRLGGDRAHLFGAGAGLVRIELTAGVVRMTGELESSMLPLVLPLVRAI